MKHAIVYSSEDCMACESVIMQLKADGVKVEDRDAATYVELDDDLRARLDEVAGVLPQVVMNGTWLKPSDIIAGRY